MLLPRAARFALLSASVSLLGACGSSDDGASGSAASAESESGGSTMGATDGGGGSGDSVTPDEPCDINTKYDGDELCIQPPGDGEGFQLHIGPDDYDDPDAVEPFLMMPGNETVECWYIDTPNEEDVYTRQRQYRMRPGSHHLILKHADPDVDVPDGWGPCPVGLSGSYGGSQNSVNDVGFGDIAPEDEGYASKIEAKTRTATELHYFNLNEEPILRETWINFYEADPETVTGTYHGIALIGLQGLDVAPGATEDLRWSVQNTVDERRVVSVVGHVHSHTTRFSAWRVTPDDERELIYELYDWEEPMGIAFNSITENPEPNADLGIEGGHSGLLHLAAGDRLEFECHVENTLETALVFGNEALTAEMCILFGRTTEDGWQAVPPRMQ